MFRSVKLNVFLQSEGHFRQWPRQVATKTKEIKFEDEWKSSKPYESIPAMTKLQAFRAFLPGGE